MREVEHFRKPAQRPWTMDQKASTTVLFGGLTLAHEELIAEAMRGLGYRIRPLPCPDGEALEVGKEYGNRGQCNPTYYTVGNLIKYLKDLEARGEEDLEDRYVFVTAGSCGPCRFGMYESEYRQALQDAGFGRFRVLLFQQGGGFNQPKGSSALEINTTFALTFIRALMLGDIVNELGYKTRPYEVVKGETDRAMEDATRVLGEALRQRRSAAWALRRVKRRFDSIRVDLTQVKPRVKIIGEIWAQTTEGDGNYHMFRWLEAEGAEVQVEPLSTWVDYKLWIARHHAAEEAKIDPSRKRTMRKLKLAQVVFRLWHQLYRWSLGFKIDPLPNQDRLAEYATPYYNTHLGGGEGHLEIGKNVLVWRERHAHMVLSLKPFGCMPSTMSDGVQSRVVADYMDAIFIPIETSGTGEVNVKSRVQMKLHEAKVRARQEMAGVLDRHSITIDQVRDYVSGHPEWSSAMRRLPQHHGAGSAANLVGEVARHIRKGAGPRPGPAA